MMLKTLLLASVMLAASSSHAAVKSGVVKSIDDNILVLDAGNREYHFQIPNDVSVTGKASELTQVQTGQRVKIKMADTQRANRGEVIAINHDTKTMQLKLQGSNKIETLHFGSQVSVKDKSSSGVNSFDNIQEGHLVTIR